jgi:hypothetical protein
VQSQLLSVAAGVEGVDRAIPLHDGVPDVTYDVDIEIMEIGHALRIDARSIAVQVPYLLKHEARQEHMSEHQLAAGIVWQVGDWAPERAIDAALLSPLAHLSGLRLYSLQRGSAAREAGRIPAQQIGVDDIRETAALLRSLHLLITVDTFIAHLAGAIGVPVWLLLCANCDWRWGHACRDSIWYPTIRIFRQPRDGDWHTVINDVIAALDRPLSRVGCRTFGTNDLI